MMFSKYLKPNNKQPGKIGTWVRCQRLAGLAVVAVALGCALGWAVELAVELGPVELAVALGARSLVVGVMVKKKCHRFFVAKLGLRRRHRQGECCGITFTV